MLPLPGCIARTAIDVVTAPVKIASSYPGHDQPVGRKRMKTRARNALDEEDLGKLDQTVKNSPRSATKATAQGVPRRVADVNGNARLKITKPSGDVRIEFTLRAAHRSLMAIPIPCAE
jgi:hypothetical protein